MGAQLTTSTPKKSQPEPEINVTPLVDVCLVLLIIFMVIAPSMENGERVELPAITKPDKTQKSKMDPITLTVGRGGTIFLEKTAMDLDALKAKLAEIHAQEPDRRVVLKGDSVLEYAKMREMFAMVQSSGFPGVSLMVSKKGNAKDGDDEEGS
jgi:biopolymer transport protein TolR